MFETVYERLKATARRELARSSGATLNTTGLVHEAYLKICVRSDLAFVDPGQFYIYAARSMRTILIDHARFRACVKGGGGTTSVTLSDYCGEDLLGNPSLALQLDAALDALEQDNSRVAKVVELHYFAGLSLEAVAGLLGVVRRTIDRDWRYARAFIGSHMC